MVSGKPAKNMPVRLERQNATGDWRLVMAAHTGDDGRCAQLLPEDENLSAGVYRLQFDSGTYFSTQKADTLYPVIQVTFEARDGDSHFHIPLLLSPNGYTTYRGS
jgi:5-hydroxyisourate hydrolase